MILRALVRAIAQLGDWRILKVLLLSLALASAAVFGVIFLGVWGVSALFGLWESANGLALPWIGEVPWLRIWGQGGAALGLTVLGAFLFFPLVAAVTSFFYDEIADAVEARHYPALPQPKAQGFWAGLGEAARFAALVLSANLLALVLGLIFPPASAFIYWGVNSYLIGREMFFVAALRRDTKKAAQALWKRHWPLLWIVAAVLFAPMHVPILNFIALVVAMASFTHLYHSLKA